MLGLIGGGLVALLALNTASAANEVRRHDLADSDQGVSASLVELQNQVQSSAAPDNLAAAAGALGMVPAGNPAFLQIDKSGRVHVLGSAAPASAVPVYVPPKAAPTPAPTQKKPNKPRPRSTKSGSASSRANASRSHAAATPTGTTRNGATPTGKPRTTAGAAPSPTHKRHPKATPTPTPTPTPVLSLPGGDR